MKKMKNLFMGLAALSCIMMFAQCTANKGGQDTATTEGQGGLSEMKVAFVEIDTLLSKYNFCIDLNEALVKKSENVRLQLNQKAQDLQKQKDEVDKANSDAQQDINNTQNQIDQALQEINKVSLSYFDFLHEDNPYQLVEDVRCEIAGDSVVC